MLEIGAYYVPWLDHMLDVVAAPAAVVAGIAVSAAAIGDVSPGLKWPLAVIAGGGGAGLAHVGTAAVRAVSTATTGGLGNPIVSTVEAVIAAVVSVLAVLLPVLGLLLLVAVVVVAWRWRAGVREAVVAHDGSDRT